MYRRKGADLHQILGESFPAVPLSPGFRDYVLSYRLVPAEQRAPTCTSSGLPSISFFPKLIMPSQTIVASSATIPGWGTAAGPTVLKLAPPLSRQQQLHKSQAVPACLTAQADAISTLNIQDLPDGVLYRIFRKLSRADTVSAASTCRDWCESYLPHACGASANVSVVVISSSVNLRHATAQGGSWCQSCWSVHDVVAARWLASDLCRG